MLNIINYQRKANQSYNNVSPVRPSSKNLQTINVGKGVEKREFFYIVDGKANWYRYYGDQHGSSLKT